MRRDVGLALKSSRVAARVRPGAHFLLQPGPVETKVLDTQRLEPGVENLEQQVRRCVVGASTRVDGRVDYAFGIAVASGAEESSERRGPSPAHRFGRAEVEYCESAVVLDSEVAGVRVAVNGADPRRT